MFFFILMLRLKYSYYILTAYNTLFLLENCLTQNDNHLIHLQNCTTGTNLQRRRSIRKNEGTTVSDMATISSGPITTRLDNGENLNGLLEFKDTSLQNECSYTFVESYLSYQSA